MSKNKYVNLQLNYCTLLPTFVCLNTWPLFVDISLYALLISRPSYLSANRRYAVNDTEISTICSIMLEIMKFNTVCI